MSDKIAGFAVTGAEGMMNNAFAQFNASLAYRRQNALMNKQNEMNNANVVNAPQMQVNGLRMAGFNPAMVAGAGSSPAPTVSQGNADMPQTIPFSAQNILLGAQLENINANTEKTNEEKRGVEQRNDITDAANDALAQTYIANIDREINDLNAELRKLPSDSDRALEVQNRIAELNESKACVADPNFRGALGIAQGLKAGADASKFNMDAVSNYLQGKLDINVLDKKLKNGTASILASIPAVERKKLNQDIESVKQLIAESESRESLNDKQVLKLQADIESIGNTILLARLNDENFLRTMAKEADSEEERKNWESRLDNLTDTEFRKLKYDVGAGIVKGVATGGAIGGASTLANKILSGKKSKSLPKVNEPSSPPRIIIDPKTGNKRPMSRNEIQGVQNFTF